MHGSSFFHVLLLTVFVVSCLFFTVTLAADAGGDKDKSVKQLLEREVVEPSLAKNHGAASTAAVPLPEKGASCELRGAINPEDDDAESCEEVGTAASDTAANEISVVVDEKEDSQPTVACCPAQEQGRPLATAEGDEKPALFDKILADLWPLIPHHAVSEESFFPMQQTFGGLLEGIQILTDTVLEVLRRNLDSKLMEKLMRVCVDEMMVEAEKVEQEAKQATLVKLLGERLDKLFAALAGDAYKGTRAKCCHLLITDGRLDDAVWEGYFETLVDGIWSGAISKDDVLKRLTAIQIAAELAKSDTIKEAIFACSDNIRTVSFYGLGWLSENKPGKEDSTHH